MAQLSRRQFLQLMGLAGVTTAAAGCAQNSARSDEKPDQMIWTTWPVGTGTYNDVAAVANVITQSEGIPVRLMTGDTPVGRIAPLIAGTAAFARVGDETYNAFEGNDEFSSANFGPQQVRLLWTPPTFSSLLVKDKSGIDSVADLKGKRIPNILASNTLNRKILAILNIAGLSFDEVELVNVSYREQYSAFATGQLDTILSNVTGAGIEELASKIPIRWLDLRAEPSAYQSWKTLAPMSSVGATTNAAGSKGEEVWVQVLTVPLSTMAARSNEEVNKVASILHDKFEAYRDATPDAHSFDVQKLLLNPMVVPYHPGVIPILEQADRWTDSHQRQQDALIERERLMAEAWPDFYAEFGAHRPRKPFEISEDWAKFKQDNLPELPGIEL